MATILSTELLHYISPVIVFIFVYAILYLVLQKADIFKSQSINAAIAFAASILFVVIPVARDLISEVVPWLVVMAIIIVVILIILMFMGYKELDIVTYMKENSFGAVITTIVIVIFLIVLAKIIGPTFYQYPAPIEAGIFSDIRRIIFNPKVLGVTFILVTIFYFIKIIGMPVKK